MKKVIRGLLAIVLLFTLTLNVKAVTITTDNTKQGTTDTNSYLVTNTGTLTVSNVDDDMLTPFKIIDYYYNSTTNSLSYEFTNQFKTFLASSTDYSSLTVEQYRNLTSGNITTGSTQTDSTLDALVSKYANYLKTNNITFDENIGKSLNTTPNQSIASDELPVGSYLILPQDIPFGTIYAVMVGNIDLEYNNNEWSVVNATIVAKKSSTNIKAYINNQDSDAINGKYYFKIGETFNYKAVVTIPEFPTNATNHDFEITSMGYDFNYVTDIESFIIKIGEEILTIKDIEQGIDSSYWGDLYSNSNQNVGKIRYYAKEKRHDDVENTNNPAGFNMIFYTDKITTNTITIEHSMQLNDNATIGNLTGANEVDLSTCTGSAYKDPDSGECASDTKTVRVYSYGIKINTKDKSNNNLTGAQYKLYSDSTLETEVGNFITNGVESTITGLEPGTYYVKQITAPNGSSSINNEVFTVNVDESQEGYVVLDVTNSGVGLLPVTGGTGTIAFILVGLLVVIAAVAYYVIRNKKKVNNVV